MRITQVGSRAESTHAIIANELRTTDPHGLLALDGLGGADRVRQAIGAGDAAVAVETATGGQS